MVLFTKLLTDLHQTLPRTLILSMVLFTKLLTWWLDEKGGNGF